MPWSSSRARNVWLILKDCMWTRMILPSPCNLKAIGTGQTTLAHAPTLKNGDKVSRFSGASLVFCSFLICTRSVTSLDSTLYLFKRGLVTFPSEYAPVHRNDLLSPVGGACSLSYVQETLPSLSTAWNALGSHTNRSMIDNLIQNSN